MVRLIFKLDVQGHRRGAKVEKDNFLPHEGGDKCKNLVLLRIRIRTGNF